MESFTRPASPARVMQYDRLNETRLINTRPCKVTDRMSRGTYIAPADEPTVVSDTGHSNETEAGTVGADTSLPENSPQKRLLRRRHSRVPIVAERMSPRAMKNLALDELLRNPRAKRAQSGLESSTVKI